MSPTVRPLAVLGVFAVGAVAGAGLVAAGDGVASYTKTDSGDADTAGGDSTSDRTSEGADTATARQVDLSLTDAYAVEQGDGWITVETTGLSRLREARICCCYR